MNALRGTYFWAVQLRMGSLLSLSLLVTVVAASVQAAPLGTAFTYQGQLAEGGSPANGTYDLRFTLYDSSAGGAQVGPVVTQEDVAVNTGVFTVPLDFGAGRFTGEARWLEIAVRPGSSSGGDPYTILSPRQPLTAAPYALYAPAAGSASDLACSGCVASTDLANGAVNTAQLAPGAVTADRIANATIQSSNLAFSPGTVTSITAGTGLTGGTITASGTIAANIGTVAGTLAAGDHNHDAAYWKLGGNTATTAGTNFLGTSDNQALELKVNAARALRLEPNAVSPNVIGGFSGNTTGAAVAGATVGGGGNVSNLNRASADYATVAGGIGNRSSAQVATVAGGSSNEASGTFSAIGGGLSNDATGNAATVAGGSGNAASGLRSAIGGGEGNTASGAFSTVGGGQSNSATADYATIGGGGRSVVDDPLTGNRVTDNYATVGGGRDNQAGDGDADLSSAFDSTVGGGYSNEASARGATVCGGSENAASGAGAMVGGGIRNEATARQAAVGGGDSNVASGTDSTVGGGLGNRASASYATIAGGGRSDLGIAGNGTGNRVTDDYGAVGGGGNNQAGNNAGTVDDRPFAAVGGGEGNTASGSHATVGGGSGNTASGSYAMIPGGRDNTAAGSYSFAAGRQASANFSGCFVWGDSTNAEVACFGPNRFVARASGGIFFYSNSDNTAGVRVAAGGADWLAISDRNAKANFAPVDGRAIAARVAALPIETWNYKSQDASVRHMGPMAQDFHAAFGVGEDEKYIGTIDADGVALAAIQGLYQMAREKDALIAKLQEQNAVLEARLTALERTVQR